MSFESEEELFRDALFRQRRKHGVYRLIDAPQLEGPVADTHCHTHMLPDPALAFARCAVNGVDFVCNIVDVVEDDPATVENVVRWVEEAAGVVGEIAPGCTADVPQIRFAVGCHPHNAKDFNAAAEARLRKVLSDSRVAAIGEIGLDFHYDLSPRDVQEAVFRRQIRLAHELNMPVSLHIREAHELALRVLEEEGFPEAGTLLHCFNLGPDDIDPWIKHDCYIALGGPVTFKKSDYTREAVKKVPLNRLLTETDAPYMTPEPMRGITCWSDHVVFTAEKMAEVRGVLPGADRAAFLAALHKNALRLLG